MACEGSLRQAGADNAMNKHRDNQMREWQTIETAPKDGTWILVYGEKYGDEDGPRFFVIKWVTNIGGVWEYIDSTTRKLVEKDWSGWSDNFAPTHWMPMPEPSKE